MTEICGRRSERAGNREPDKERTRAQAYMRACVHASVYVALRYRHAFDRDRGLYLGTCPRWIDDKSLDEREQARASLADSPRGFADRSVVEAENQLFDLRIGLAVRVQIRHYG